MFLFQTDSFLENKGDLYPLEYRHRGADSFYAGLCAEVLYADESTGYTGHRQAGLLRVCPSG